MGEEGLYEVLKQMPGQWANTPRACISFSISCINEMKWITKQGSSDKNKHLLILHLYLIIYEASKEIKAISYDQI